MFHEPPQNSHKSSQSTIIVDYHSSSRFQDGEMNTRASSVPCIWADVLDSFSASSSGPLLQALMNKHEFVNNQLLSPKVQDAENTMSASDQLQICQQVLDLANERRIQLRDATSNAAIEGVKSVYVRVVTWVSKFVFLGDVIAQVDPVHIGLPWAAIRAILVVSLLAIYAG